VTENNGKRQKRLKPEPPKVHIGDGVYAEMPVNGHYPIILSSTNQYFISRIFLDRDAINFLKKLFNEYDL
jgi:hypothetical protein